MLALDVGDRRIGVALSDSLGYTAQPLLTVHRSTLREDLKSLARLIRRYEVSTVLIGLPLHASGDPSPQSVKTVTFADALRAHLQQVLPSMPELLLLDERHTTAGAHHLLGPRHSAADRAERSSKIDQVAAAILLEGWLRRRSPALLPDPDA